jgi:hypothetical protein
MQVATFKFTSRDVESNFIIHTYNEIVQFFVQRIIEIKFTKTILRYTVSLYRYTHENITKLPLRLSFRTYIKYKYNRTIIFGYDERF